MIEAMDQASEAKANLKEVSNQLKIEKMLIIKKDEEIQSAMLKIGDEHEKVVVDFQALESFGIIIFGKFFKGFELLRQWTMKHHLAVVDYSDLDFEAIDKEMMANERVKSNEQARVEGRDEGEGPVDALADPPIDPASSPTADLVVDPAF